MDLSNRTRARQVVLPAAAVALSFTLLLFSQAWVQSVALDLPLDETRLLSTVLTRWLLFAAFTPLIALLASNRPIGQGWLPGRLFLQLVAAIGLAALHPVLTALIYTPLHVYPRADGIAEATERLLMAHWAGNLIVLLAISGIFHAVYHYQTLQARDRQTAALQMRLAEARLGVLRAQLNPHFLFNTLNVISSLALTGQREQVATALSRLADVLRSALDPQLPQEVTLARELSILDPYLELQGIRFGDRLSIRRDVAPDVLDALFPSMMLQPLVENALQHGLSKRPGPGTVTIRAHRRNGTLHVRVDDDGPGFTTAAGGKAGPGIGLLNTEARLQQLHAGASAFRFGNGSEGGAFVEIEVPFRSASSRESS